mgnify:CR=1 FL=1
MARTSEDLKLTDCYRNVWQGLRHAILARPVHDLLFRLPDLLPPLPS